MSLKKRFRIPNADVALDGIEVNIIHTRQFQRLFFLRQLGLSYLVYPGATHTRGAHSIETLYQASLILDALRENFTISDRDYKAVRLAALLHDIGHIPFSHILEDEHCVLEKHDGKKRVEQAFALLAEDLAPMNQEMSDRLLAAKEILIAVSEKDRPDRDEFVKDWRSDVVGNTICADLLAYINADAAWTGIEKRAGHYRIYEYFRLAKESCSKRDGSEYIRERLCIILTKKGVLRTDVVSAMLDLLDMRYAITERVTFHHAKCVASAMLARVVRLCGLSDEDSGYLLRIGDEVFLEFLESKASKLDELHRESASHLLNELRSRRLYKRVFKVSRLHKDASKEGNADTFSEEWRDREKVESALCNIEDSLSMSRGSLVLWCSDPRAGKKLVRANVIWEAPDCKGPVELRHKDIEERFPAVHKRVVAVESQYDDLWCFWVALDRRYVKKVAAVMEACEAKFRVSCDKMFKEALRNELNLDERREALSARVKDVYTGIHGDVVDELMDTAALAGDDDNIPLSVIKAKLIERVDRMKADVISESDAPRVKPKRRVVKEKEEQMALRVGNEDERS